jgi:hypothetical protein
MPIPCFFWIRLRAPMVITIHCATMLWSPCQGPTNEEHPVGVDSSTVGWLWAVTLLTRMNDARYIKILYKLILFSKSSFMFFGVSVCVRPYARTQNIKTTFH